MPIRLRFICFNVRCRMTGWMENLKTHRCLDQRDHSDDPVKIEIKHQAHSKRAGDLCYCGGNPDHGLCGGTGRI